MDYRYLKAFCAAARLQNFAKGAEELGIAPSAFTRQIQLFEQSLDRDCFTRIGRNIRLNTYGEALYRRVLAFEGQQEDIKQKLDSTLRIGCLQSVCESIMNGFLAKHGHLLAAEISLEIGSPRHLRQMFLEGRLDVILNTLSLSREGYRSVRLCSESLRIVSKQEKFLASPDQAIWIIYTPLEHAWQKLLKARLRSSQQTIRTNSLNTAIDLAALGVGITLVPEGRYLARHGFKTLKSPRHVSEDIFLTMVEYQQIPPLMQKFEKLLSSFINC